MNAIKDPLPVTVGPSLNAKPFAFNSSACPVAP